MAVQRERETSAVSLLTTELDGLADAAGAVTGTATTGATYTRCDVELYLSSATLSAGDVIADLYFIRDVDGTNFEDYASGASATAPANAYVGTFTAGKAVTTAASRNVLREIVVPPANFHVLLVNKSGAAFAASGNTLKIRKYREKDV